jgi:hypothetical protein
MVSDITLLLSASQRAPYQCSCVSAPSASATSQPLSFRNIITSHHRSNCRFGAVGEATQQFDGTRCTTPPSVPQPYKQPSPATRMTTPSPQQHQSTMGRRRDLTRQEAGPGRSSASHHAGHDRQGQAPRGAAGLLGTVRRGRPRCCAITRIGRCGSCVQTPVLLCN